jgi:RHS repeat-associated protein
MVLQTRLSEQTTASGRTTTWEYAPGSHTPLTQTHHTPLVRKPGVSALSPLVDDPDRPRETHFHTVITDLAGTPTELITTDGVLAWQHRTTLWGTDYASPAEETKSPDCPLRFPGQYADAETGLHYNYNRYDDPETARYLTPDLLGLEPTPNSAAYVNNPHVVSDPVGLKPCKVRVSSVASDWATKGAHVHIGTDEVRITVDDKGNVVGEPLRMSKTGWASDKNVKAAVKEVNADPKLQADLVAKAKSARDHMLDHNWGDKQNRAAEMQALMDKLEKTP